MDEIHTPSQDSRDSRKYPHESILDASPSLNNTQVQVGF